MRRLTARVAFVSGWLLRAAGVAGMVLVCTVRIDPEHVGPANLLLLWALAAVAWAGQWAMDRARRVTA